MLPVNLAAIYLDFNNLVVTMGILSLAVAQLCVGTSNLLLLLVLLKTLNLLFKVAETLQLSLGLIASLQLLLWASVTLWLQLALKASMQLLPPVLQPCSYS